MRHLSIHESAANTQHTHNYCIFYATHVQHVRVSGRPGVLSEQLCACSTAALHTSKKKKKGNKKKKRKKKTVVCTMIRIFLLITLLQSCHRLFPILCNNCATVRLSGLEEGPRRLNRIFSLMSRISWLLCFAFLASQVHEKYSGESRHGSQYALLNDGVGSVTCAGFTIYIDLLSLKLCGIMRESPSFCWVITGVCVSFV